MEYMNLLDIVRKLQYLLHLRFVNNSGTLSTTLLLLDLYLSTYAR